MKQLTTKEIKTFVKQSLSDRCSPKSLNLFYYFYYTYHTSNNTNSGYSFVSTYIIKNRLGYSKASGYKKYFDKWIEQMSDEYVMGEKCRKITKWSASFIKLMEQTKGIKIPKDFYQKFYWNSIDIEQSELEHLREVYNKYINTNSGYSFASLELYHNTPNSSWRWYHFLQTLSRCQKLTMFEGMWDIDINSCFSSIAYHELGITDERLNPALKEDFRQWVMKECGVEYKEAKQIISRLFTGKHTKYNKYPWYDQLFNKINKAVWAECKRLSTVYPKCQWNHHQYFTFMEQGIINKILPVVILVLRMHDGLICKDKPDLDEINRLAAPHTFSMKMLCKEEK